MPIYEILPDQIKPVSETSYGSEGLKEREDIQRLLRSNIEVVAPDTLVISEEYGEWDESNRRIDLLGLDKDANLVVFELKRTNDGGHLELQALRYAAMVSTMTFEQAVDAYGAFLIKNGKEMDPQQGLLDFLEWKSPDADHFAQDVRIVLVAGDFSKEITTSVIWLNEHDLDIRCVRMKPYKYEGRVLVDIQQVIPLPEAIDYQVQVRTKAVQERTARRTATDLELFCKRFWTSLLGYAQGKTDLHANISPVAGYYVGASYKKNFQLNYCIGKTFLRVELYIDSEDKDTNKALFDQLYSRKAAIESSFGGPLGWERLDTKRACRIKADLPGLSMMKEEDWPMVTEAMVDAMIRLEAAMKPRIKELDR
jgi:hypothetical protein